MRDTKADSLPKVEGLSKLPLASDLSPIYVSKCFERRTACWWGTPGFRHVIKPTLLICTQI